MKRLFHRALLTVFACLALAAPSRAGLINWDYSTGASPSTVPADGVSPTSSITLSNDSLVHAANSSDIILAGLTANSSAGAGAPDTFTNAHWSVGLTITDKASGLSGTLTFTGVFNGTLSTASSNVNNTFTGLTTQSLVLGGNTYSVTANSYVPPSIPNTTDTGGIGALVTVSGGVTTGLQSPEPSSLLLCGFGAMGCALAGWRKRLRR